VNLLDPKSLEDQIAHFLIKGGRGTTELLKELQTLRPGTTKQGFYAALRKLKAEDVVVVYKKVVALNVTWVKQMEEMLARAAKTYTVEDDSSNLLSLADKESVSYSFASIKQLDNYWGHAQNIVVQATPADEPVYTYDPHYWFYIARPEVERGHMDGINALGKQFLMTVGGATPLDKAIQYAFNNELRQYHMERMFAKERYYVVVIGDYIFESTFNEDIERRIGDIYARDANPAAEVAKAFESILNAKVRGKLKITRNRTKARKLKAKLGKNFVIKKQGV